MSAPKGRWNPEVAKVIQLCIGNSLYCHNAGHPESVQLEDTRSHKIVFDGTCREARAFIRARIAEQATTPPSPRQPSGHQTTEAAS